MVSLFPAFVKPALKRIPLKPLTAKINLALQDSILHRNSHYFQGDEVVFSGKSSKAKPSTSNKPTEKRLPKACSAHNRLDDSEDWTKLTFDDAERRKLQNRLAQREFKKRKKEAEEAMKKAALQDINSPTAFSPKSSTPHSEIFGLAHVPSLEIEGYSEFQQISRNKLPAPHDIDWFGVDNEEFQDILMNPFELGNDPFKNDTLAQSVGFQYASPSSSQFPTQSEMLNDFAESSFSKKPTKQGFSKACRADNGSDDVDDWTKLDQKDPNRKRIQNKLNKRAQMERKRAAKKAATQGSKEVNPPLWTRVKNMVERRRMQNNIAKKKSRLKRREALGNAQNAPEKASPEQHIETDGLGHDFSIQSADYLDLLHTSMNDLELKDFSHLMKYDPLLMEGFQGLHTELTKDLEIPDPVLNGVMTEEGENSLTF